MGVGEKGAGLWGGMGRKGRGCGEGWGEGGGAAGRGGAAAERVDPDLGLCG